MRLAPAWAAVFVALALFQITLVWTHVPWMDELQAVLLARDSRSLSDWYWNFRYEGHPPLWHLLLKLPLMLGLSPAISLKLLLTPIAVGTLALIAFKAPFAPHWRLLLGLNYFFLFEYGAIARPYSLGGLLLLAALAWRRHPMAWVPVALLPTCGLQFVLLTLVMGWLLWRERSIWIPGVGLTLASILVALIWIYPAPDFQSSLSPGVLATSYVESLKWAILRAGVVLFPMDLQGGPAAWTQPVGMTTLLAAGGAMLPAWALASLWPNRTFVLVAGAFVTATFAISIFSFGLSARHFGLIFLLALALTWVRLQEGERLNAVFGAWIFMLGLQGAVVAATSFQHPFATTRDLAAWLQTSGETEAVFVPVGVGIGAEITAVTARPTIDHVHSCLQTFARTRAPAYALRLRAAAGPRGDLSAEGGRVLVGDLERIAARAGGRILILADRPRRELIELAARPSLRVIATFADRRPGGQFDRWIYEMRVAPDPGGAPFPDCRDLIPR